MSKNIPSEYCTYKTLTDRNLCIIQNTGLGYDEYFSYNKYYFVRKVNFINSFEKPKLQPITSDVENDNILLPFNRRDYKIINIVGYTNIDNVICPVVEHAFNTKYYAVKDGELKEVKAFYNKEKDLKSLLEQYHKNIKTNIMSKNIIINKPKEFYTLDNLINPNLIVIHYERKKMDINKNEVYYKSITHNKYYIAEKNNNKYYLQTLNKFERASDGIISLTCDNRFTEFKIDGWVEYQHNLCPSVRKPNQSGCYFIYNGELIENKHYPICVLYNKEGLKKMLKIYQNIQYGESINPCAEIKLPGYSKQMIHMLPSDNGNYEIKLPNGLVIEVEVNNEINNDINWIPSVENINQIEIKSNKVKIDMDELLKTDF